MKKIMIFCMMLMVMSACVEHAEIYKLLPASEAALIPYQMGQTVSFTNQNGDTLAFSVVLDETHLFDGENYNPYGDEKMHYLPQNYCYARSVNLECERTSDKLSFTIVPGKELFAFWNRDLLIDCFFTYNPAETVTIDGTTYNQVHSGILYSSQTGELLFEWHYSAEYGLISAKFGGKSLTLLP